VSSYQAALQARSPARSSRCAAIVLRFASAIDFMSAALLENASTVSSIEEFCACSDRTDLASRYSITTDERGKIIRTITAGRAKMKSHPLSDGESIGDPLRPRNKFPQVDRIIFELPPVGYSKFQSPTSCRSSRFYGAI